MRPRSNFPSGAVHDEGGGPRGCAGVPSARREAAEAAKAADEAKKAAATAARGIGLDGVAAQARRVRCPRRRRSRVAERRSPPQDGPGQSAGRGLQAEGRSQRPRKRRRSSTRQDRRESKPDRRRRKDAVKAAETRRPPRQGGERGQARARAGLDLHQPRDAKTDVRRHTRKPAPDGGGGVRYFASRFRSRSAIPQEDRHALVHSDGAIATRACAGARTDRSRRRRQERARPHRHPAGGSIASLRPPCRDPRSSSRTSRRGQ